MFENKQNTEKNENISLGELFVRGAYDVVSVAVSAVVVVLLVFVFGFRMVGVVQSSMVPTLENGNSVIVTAFMPKVKTNDIVIITVPQENDPLVKRVIATGGQTIRINFESGEIWIDGELKVEPFIRADTHVIDRFPLNIDDHTGEIVVPDDSVFVMGDNRNESRDSRSSLGTVRTEYLLGKVLFRVRPFGKWNVYASTFGNQS